MAGPWNRHRRDKSQDSIVKRLRDLGCSVLDLSQVGGSCPDLLVGTLGRDYLVEVKSHGRMVTAEQQDFHDNWLGKRPVILYTAEDAECWVQNTRRLLFSEWGVK